MFSYDARYCEACKGEASLLEVDEATQIEIQALGMIRDGENTSRLVQAGDVPDFYDVMVRAVDFDSGKFLMLHEIEDMDREAADRAVARMMAFYPLAGLSCHYGVD